MDDKMLKLVMDKIKTGKYKKEALIYIETDGNHATSIHTGPMMKVLGLLFDAAITVAEKNGYPLFNLVLALSLMIKEREENAKNS